MRAEQNFGPNAPYRLLGLTGYQIGPNSPVCAHREHATPRSATRALGPLLRCRRKTGWRTAGSTIELPVGDVGEGRLAAAARRKCGRGSRAQHAARPARPARSAHSCADGQRPAGAQRGGQSRCWWRRRRGAAACGSSTARPSMGTSCRRRCARRTAAAGTCRRATKEEGARLRRERQLEQLVAQGGEAHTQREHRPQPPLRRDLPAPAQPQPRRTAPECAPEPRPAACVQTAHGPCGVRRLAASSARLVARGRTESTGSRRPKVSIAGEEARRGNKSWHAVRGGGERMARAKEALSSARRGRGRADRAGEGAVHGTPRAGSGVGSRSSLSRLLILASLVYISGLLSDIAIFSAFLRVFPRAAV